MIQRVFAFAFAAMCFLSLPDNCQGQFIPIADRKDHVFDHQTGLLYITTSNGTVERYDSSTSSFLTAWNVGGDLGGIDLTPDGSTLFVADRTFDLGTAKGTIRKIDTQNGNITTKQFDLSESDVNFHETGSWDVVATSNNHALFTTDFFGSAWTPFREWDLSTDTINERPSSFHSGGTFLGVRERTWLTRDANYQTMAGFESDSSAGPVFTYDKASDSFLAGEDLGFFPGETPRSIFHSDAVSAISPNGNWIATEIESTNEVWILDKNLTTIQAKLSNIEGGIHFDPNFKLLYGFDVDTDEIVTFSTQSWLEVDRYGVGGNLIDSSRFSDGFTSFDRANGTLYVSVGGGIFGINVSTPVPEPSAFIVIAASALVSFRRRR